MGWGRFTCLIATLAVAALGVGAPAATAAAGEVVVGFDSGTSAADQRRAVEAAGGRVVDSVSALDVALAEFSSAPGAIRTLNADDRVDAAEPNRRVHGAFVPNDPFLAQQWALPMIHAFDAWNVGLGLPTTLVAVLDTGIDATHPDLVGKVLGGHDFVNDDTDAADDQGHGTAVAGVAAAVTNNGQGIAGVCPGCTLLSVKVLDATVSGDLFDVIDGIVYAAQQGADVLALPLGVSEDLELLEQAVDFAVDSGAVVTCAAGNGTSSDPVYPAAYEGCFGVAASDQTDTKAGFSNFGSWVDAAAPGVAILTTNPFASPNPLGPYSFFSGTSYATAHAAGLAGLLDSRGLTATQVRQLMCATAAPIPGTGTFWQCGRIDAGAAMLAPPPPCDPSECPPPLITCEGLAATVTGSGTINGGAGDDVIVGSGGADTIDGGGGNDRICAGAGDDRVSGGPGNDRLFGEEGSDRLFGGAGSAAPDPAGGDDHLDGAAGSDRLFGEGGNDVNHGGDGNDVISDATGNDTVNGDAGNDQLSGAAGNDTISGAAGADTLNGGVGTDSCDGGADTDTAGSTCETKPNVP